MKIWALLILALLFFCISEPPFALFILTVVFCGAWYYFHQNREVYKGGLARQATDALCSASEKFNRLLETEGITSLSTQEALRALIHAQIDMRETHPAIDHETAIASLIKLVKK